MVKILTPQEAISKMQDGMTVAIGGFLGCGCPDMLIDEVIKQGYKNLTLICNDTGFPGRGVGKLQDDNRLARAYVSYIGAHPETGRQMQTGEMEVILTPQGSIAEMLRAAGAGLGGVLTPTGIGTIVEEGKQVLTIEGKQYILEKPLKADVALLKAHKADKRGNLVYRRAARNFNPVMATAADLVIVQAEELVETGEIDPDMVHTPGVYVDILVNMEGSQNG
ncbi:CoA transferase subunit A [Desulfitibacter alkalitolerans]|uniref:CoA transferase subunit A n=1 Tax=Desulfitibacter alkalitolerans TaxID=264641 RepID=UPI000489EC24|nr:CoA transferase subunit A [Desulfitibacter alkalitolerans]